MMRKVVIPFFLAFTMITVAACASLQLPGSSQNPAQAARTPGAFDPRQMTVEMKLAVGTFKLEKTDLAVTPAEAKELLPLWKAVKSLSASDTASPEEIQALYNQIKETMTPEQVQSIEKMDLSQEDFGALMKDLGIAFPQGGPGGASQNLTDDQRATRVAQFQAQNPGGRRNGQGGGGFSGPGGGQGFDAPPGGGAFPGQGNGNGTVRQTPVAGQRTARRGLGMNTIFVDPLIKMLETRANG
jgi:hypothetical protein